MSLPVYFWSTRATLEIDPAERPRAWRRQVPQLLVRDTVGGAAGAWGEDRAGEQGV